MFILKNLRPLNQSLTSFQTVRKSCTISNCVGRKAGWRRRRDFMTRFLSTPFSSSSSNIPPNKSLEDAHTEAVKAFQEIEARREASFIRFQCFLEDLAQLNRARHSGDDPFFEDSRVIDPNWSPDTASPHVVRVPNPNNIDSITVSEVMGLLDQLVALKGDHDCAGRVEFPTLLEAHSFQSILKAAGEMLQKEPNVRTLEPLSFKDRGQMGAEHGDHRLPPAISVIGDLHGSLRDLAVVLDLCGPPNPHTGNVLVFNGDFVDRGEDSVEVLAIILLLKLASPTCVHLNRGNHEDIFVGRMYGFYEELLRKYGDKTTILYQDIATVFSQLSLAAVIPGVAFIVHAGLPASLGGNGREESIRDINQLKRIRRAQHSRTVLSEAQRKAEKSQMRSLLRNSMDIESMLWSDPSPKRCGFTTNSRRGAGNIFGPDVAKEWMRRNDVHLLFRSHECIGAGWELIDCGNEFSIITVFSATDYGSSGNNGAVARISFTDGHPNALSRSQSITMDAVEIDNAVLKEKGYRVEIYSYDEYYMDDDVVYPNVVSKKDKRSSELDGNADYAAVRRLLLCSLASMLPYDDHNSIRDTFNLDKGTQDLELSQEEWCRLMTEQFTLDVNWQTLFPLLITPQTGLCDDERSINIDKFLISLVEHRELSEEEVDASAIFRNDSMEFRALFRLLDEDSDGVVTRTEFDHGVELLNSYRASRGDSEAAYDAKTLFALFGGTKDNACLDINEFCRKCGNAKRLPEESK